MDTIEIINKAKENLCYYDKENPDNNNEFNELTEEDVNNLKENCCCDNCFYGRTELANIILNLLKNGYNKTCS